MGPQASPRHPRATVHQCRGQRSLVGGLHAGLVRRWTPLPDPQCAGRRDEGVNCFDGPYVDLGAQGGARTERVDRAAREARDYRVEQRHRVHLERDPEMGQQGTGEEAQHRPRQADAKMDTARPSTDVCATIFPMRLYSSASTTPARPWPTESASTTPSVPTRRSATRPTRPSPPKSPQWAFGSTHMNRCADRPLLRWRKELNSKAKPGFSWESSRGHCTPDAGCSRQASSGDG